MSRLLTVPEVAGKLRIANCTVYELVRKRRLPAIRLRGKLLFREDAIDELLRKAEQPALTSDSPLPATA